MTEPIDFTKLAETINAARAIAINYRKLTGKPLGITGEVGEFLAAQLLGLTLEPARQAGYDAKGPDGRRIQIKARCLADGSKPGQQVGSIRLHHEWDSVVLVLMDERFEAVQIFEAPRAAVESALLHPGSKARNERGALAVSKFKSIGKTVWHRDSNRG